MALLPGFDLADHTTPVFIIPHTGILENLGRDRGPYLRKVVELEIQLRLAKTRDLELRDGLLECRFELESCLLALPKLVPFGLHAHLPFQFALRKLHQSGPDRVIDLVRIPVEYA